MNRDGRTKYLDWILKYEKKKKSERAELRFFIAEFENNRLEVCQ